MPETPRVSGSCFCGAVRFEVELPTLFCGHCHCSMCRRSNGSAFVTWFSVGIDQFHLIESSTLVRFSSSEHGSRSFCGRCGTQLFCANDRHPERIDITLASMASAIDRQPQAHVYFDCRAEWIEGQEELPKLGGASGIEKLGEEARSTPGSVRRL